MQQYNYASSGLDGDGQQWTCSNTVEAPEFDAAIDAARADTFLKLTQGKAEFGNPGKGCRGPYKLLSFAIAVITTALNSDELGIVDTWLEGVAQVQVDDGDLTAAQDLEAARQRAHDGTLTKADAEMLIESLTDDTGLEDEPGFESLLVKLRAIQ